MEEAGAWHRALAYGSAVAGPVTLSHISEVLHRAPDPGDDHLECSWGLGFSGQVLWEDNGARGSRMMECRLEKNEKSWEPGWS